MAENERKPEVRRKYSPEEKAQALTVLAGCLGNAEEASRQLGIPARTLLHWRDRPASGSVRAQVAVRQELMCQTMERLVWKLLRAVKVPGRIQGAKLAQVINGATALYDRMQQIRDRSQGSNAIADSGGLDLSQLSSDELRTFLALAQKAGQPGKGLTAEKEGGDRHAITNITPHEDEAPTLVIVSAAEVLGDEAGAEQGAQADDEQGAAPHLATPVPREDDSQ